MCFSGPKNAGWNPIHAADHRIGESRLQPAPEFVPFGTLINQGFRSHPFPAPPFEQFHRIFGGIDEAVGIGDTFASDIEGCAVID